MSCVLRTLSKFEKKKRKVWGEGSACEKSEDFN